MKCKRKREKRTLEGGGEDMVCFSGSSGLSLVSLGFHIVSEPLLYERTMRKYSFSVFLGIKNGQSDFSVILL